MARISLRTNAKFLKLCRRIQRPPYQARGLLEMLWEAAHENGPVFKTLEDIEAVSTWDGDFDVFANAVIDLGFVDASDDGYTIHDYWEHAPKWVKDRESKRQNRGHGADSVRHVAECRRHGAENGDSERHVADKKRHGAPSVAKRSVEEDQDVCSQPPAAATNQQPQLFKPTTKTPCLSTDGPYNVDESDVYKWVPCRRCKDPRGWPFFREYGKYLTKHFAAVGEISTDFEEFIVKEVDKAIFWIEENPSRQKFPGGMRSYFSRWIKNEINKRGRFN